MMRMAASFLLVGAAAAQDIPLECKKYEVTEYKGCDDVSALNTCDKVGLVPDNSLCRYQLEKDQCDDPDVTNITACPAKYPQSINATSEEATSEAKAIILKPKSWVFLEATVAAGVPMYSAKYSLQVLETVDGGGDENNISVAFLVGRCLDEVECGQCPPRAETLMSTEREPQICTLPDYCPGCTERLGQEGGCNTYESIGGGYKAYTGKWSNLKRCQTEPEDTKFYIGIYAMDTVFGSGVVDQSVEVKLKVWWDATSAGPRAVPSVVLALCVAVAAMFQ